VPLPAPDLKSKCDRNGERSRPLPNLARVLASQRTRCGAEWAARMSRQRRRPDRMQATAPASTPRTPGWSDSYSTYLRFQIGAGRIPE